MSTFSTVAQRLASSEAELLWRNWKERRDTSSRDRLVLAYAPIVALYRVAQGSRVARALRSRRPGIFRASSR